MVFTGKISYSLYLWHWPIIAFSNYYLFRALTAGESVAAFALSYALAVLSWRWVEQPARNIKLSKRYIFMSAAAVTGLFAAMGVIGYRSQGFPSRFPQADTRSYTGIYREGPCQVMGQRFADWKEAQCTFPSPKFKDGPTVFVWGDSFASQYVEGLRKLTGALKFNLIQGTAGDCRPLLGEDNKPACEQFNRSMIAHLITERPTVLVMAGIWYDVRSRSELQRRLIATINPLQKAGISILLIGDSPLYYSDMRRVQRMMKQRGVNTEWYTPVANEWADPIFKQIAAIHGLTFFSPREFWCRKDKCRFTDGQLITFDTGHLTEHGSVLIARGLQPKIGAALENGK